MEVPDRSLAAGYRDDQIPADNVIRRQLFELSIRALQFDLDRERLAQFLFVAKLQHSQGLEFTTVEFQHGGYAADT